MTCRDQPFQPRRTVYPTPPALTNSALLTGRVAGLKWSSSHANTQVNIMGSEPLSPPWTPSCGQSLLFPPGSLPLPSRALSSGLHAWGKLRAAGASAWPRTRAETLSLVISPRYHRESPKARDHPPQGNPINQAVHEGYIYNFCCSNRIILFN